MVHDTLLLLGEGIQRCFCLTSVCRVHRAYVENRDAQEDQNWHRCNARHMWLGHHFQGQRSRSPGRFAHHRVGTSDSCSGRRENVLAMGNCCYVAVCSMVEGTSAPMGEERGGDIPWWPPAYSLFV